MFVRHTVVWIAKAQKPNCGEFIRQVNFITPGESLPSLLEGYLISHTNGDVK
jgi:hypothetical protein